MTLLQSLLKIDDASERLAFALKMRGFHVKLENDLLSLQNGTHLDYKQVKILLHTLSIPVFWMNDQQFQLIVTHFPLKNIEEIIAFKGREYPVSVDGYRFKWRSFVNRRYGIRINTLDLDPYTAVLTGALNRAGIVTLSGCNGHGRYAPHFKISGVYNGIWLTLVQQQYISDIPLHYQWHVTFEGAVSTLRAVSSNQEEWDMRKVLSDCCKMAERLDKKAADIRQWKKEAFKRNMKKIAEPLRSAGNIEELYAWMQTAAGQVKQKKVRSHGEQM